MSCVLWYLLQTGLFSANTVQAVYFRVVLLYNYGIQAGYTFTSCVGYVTSPARLQYIRDSWDQLHPKDTSWQNGVNGIAQI